MNHCFARRSKITSADPNYSTKIPLSDVDAPELLKIACLFRDNNLC